MDYVEYRFTVEPREPFAEILLAELSELAFDTFEDTPEGLAAWAPEGSIREEDVKSLELFSSNECRISFTVARVEKQNWNALWESEFEPISVKGKVYVRAPFHSPSPGHELDLVIEPKMSFGTGHHSTTLLMMEQMLETDLTGKLVLDMGCGTSILAILASRLGAKAITGIDIEEWAVENSAENAQRNGVNNLTVFLGNVDLIAGKQYDVILANINRNVLTSHMSSYASALVPGGVLLLSGFFETDIPAITEKAVACGLQPFAKRVHNGWAQLTFNKVNT